MPTGVYIHKPHSVVTKLKLSRRAKAHAPNFLGKHHTPETKKKIGDRHKGKKLSESHKKAISIAMSGENNPRLGKHHSIKTKKMIGDGNRGKNNGMFGKFGASHPGWKGNKRISQYNEYLRKSLKFREWRREVFERDNYTCQNCHREGGNLEPHHIESFDINPKLRFKISNGITFCEDCHTEFHCEFGFGKNNKEQLYLFVRIP